MIAETVTDQREKFIRGERSAREAVELALGRIRAVDPKVRAFLAVTEESARRQAGELDAKRARGDRLGRLAGVMLAIKDNICVRGERMTCGSRILESFVSPYDATAVARLRSEDALFLGKTNLDEFAMGSSTENSAFFATRNPWDLDRSPGGSSGGSAAAVSAGLVPAALGSDTGGSIRQPAALTGIVGFKPTYGRISRFGLVAFASSLDQIGPMARTVADVALLGEVMSGPDPMDATTADRRGSEVAIPAKFSPGELRIGVPREYFEGGGVEADTAARVEDALRLLEKKGARLVPVSLPRSRYGVPTYYIVAPAEASANLARYDGVRYGFRRTGGDSMEQMRRTRAEGFGAEVIRRIMLGTFTLSTGYYEAYYKRALQVRRLIKEDFDRAFESCDVIAGPTSPMTSFKLGEKVTDPLAMYLCDTFTVTANLVGIPAISIPVGLDSKNLPVGLQFQGRAFEDATVLAAACLVEREFGPAPVPTVE